MIFHTVTQLDTATLIGVGSLGAAFLFSLARLLLGFARNGR